MSSWKDYKGQVPWTASEEGQKPRYNEGDRITKAPIASGGSPVWSMEKKGTAITDRHIPCGYWTRNYVPVSTEEGDLDAIFYIFYIDDVGTYQVAVCSLSASKAITVVETKTFDEVGISDYTGAHQIHFMIKPFTHNVKDISTGIEVARTLYFISTDLWLSEDVTPLVYDTEDPFSWLAGSTYSPMNWYVLDPLLLRIYLIDYYSAPFDQCVRFSDPSPYQEYSINFSEDNYFIYTAGPTIGAWENAYKVVNKYSLLDNEITLVSSANQQAGFTDTQYWRCLIGRDGLLAGPPQGNVPHYTYDVASKEGYFEYNFVDNGWWDSGGVVVSHYIQEIIPQNLGAPLNLYTNDGYDDPYYITPWTEDIKVFQGDLVYNFPMPWISIHTANLFVQSLCIEEYGYHFGGSYGAIKRLYKDEESWLAEIMSAVGVVSEENLLGIAYIPKS